MTAATTAHQVFKHHYPRYVRGALAAALALHVLLLVMSPPFEFKPLEMAVAADTMIVEKLENIVIPKPPKDTEPPPVVEPDPKGIDEIDQRFVTSGNEFPDVPIRTRTTRARPAFVAYDRAPKAIRLAVPKYPKLARSASMEGTVRVRVLIGTDGKVLAVSVHESDATVSMEKAALEAAKKCRFEPARQGPVPVTAYVVIPFEFRLSR